MGNDNLFLLKGQFSLLFGKCSRGSALLSAQNQINRFCLKITMGELQPTMGTHHSQQHPWSAHTYSCSWWVGYNGMGKPGSAVGITGKTPPLFPCWGCVSICDLHHSSQIHAALPAWHQRQELDSRGEMTLRRTSSTDEFANDFLPSHFKGGIILSSCSAAGCSIACRRLC